MKPKLLATAVLTLALSATAVTAVPAFASGGGSTPTSRRGPAGV